MGIRTDHITRFAPTKSIVAHMLKIVKYFIMFMHKLNENWCFPVIWTL